MIRFRISDYVTVFGRLSTSNINRVYRDSSRFDRVRCSVETCGEVREPTSMHSRTNRLSKTAAQAHHCRNTRMMEWTYSRKPTMGTKKAWKRWVVEQNLEVLSERNVHPNHIIIPTNKFIHFEQEIDYIEMNNLNQKLRIFWCSITV